ncbi:MAG: CAP domain-containing protein [Methanoregula sp.]|jgi:uncharacterized protein YkwD|nr:CAP domain-containing protein [Methanoregula sp.]
MRHLRLFVIACMMVAVAALLLNFLFPEISPWAGSLLSPGASEQIPATPAVAATLTGNGTPPLPRYASPTPSRFSVTSSTPTEKATPSPTLSLTLHTRSATDNPYTISQTALAPTVHDLINQQRTAHGLAALSFDVALADIARRHSEDMAKQHYFAHMNPAGQNPTARGTAAGYTCRKDFGSYYSYGIAENLFQNNLYSSATYFSNSETVYTWNSPGNIAESTVAGWMNSSGHRENILTPTFDREGIGVAIASDAKVYITENFC